MDALPPLTRDPGCLRGGVLLHWRAGFAATREEAETDLRDGLEASVGRFLDGQGHTTGVAPDHARIAERIGDAAVASRDPGR